MALLPSHSATNRVVTNDLAVVYSKERIYGSWAFLTGVGVTTTYKSVWQYTRRATKVYRYVGMTRSAAQSCATAMITLFTRETKASEIPAGVASEFTDVSSGSVPMANISCEYVDGEMWCVSVTVDEIDTRLRVSGSATPSSLFTTENNRSYDT